MISPTESIPWATGGYIRMICPVFSPISQCGTNHGIPSTCTSPTDTFMIMQETNSLETPMLGLRNLGTSKTALNPRRDRVLKWSHAACCPCSGHHTRSSHNNYCDPLHCRERLKVERRSRCNDRKISFALCEFCGAYQNTCISKIDRPLEMVRSDGCRSNPI